MQHPTSRIGSCSTYMGLDAEGVASVRLNGDERLCQAENPFGEDLRVREVELQLAPAQQLDFEYP